MQYAFVVLYAHILCFWRIPQWGKDALHLVHQPVTSESDPSLCSLIGEGSIATVGNKVTDRNPEMYNDVKYFS